MQQAEMSMSRVVIFSHGKGGDPYGDQLVKLMEVARAYGYEAVSVDYRDCATAGDRVERLRGILAGRDTREMVLVGQSMGGYVSAVVANEVPVKGMFLLSPAVYKPAPWYTVTTFAPRTERVAIVHGREDDVVPCANSKRYVEETGVGELYVVEDDHHLSHSDGYLVDRLALFLETLHTESRR